MPEQFEEDKDLAELQKQTGEVYKKITTLRPFKRPHSGVDLLPGE